MLEGYCGRGLGENSWKLELGGELGGSCLVVIVSRSRSNRLNLGHERAGC